MTKVEQQRLALALLKARPPVIPNTRVVVNEDAREVWYAAVFEVAKVAWPKKVPPSWFFDAAGVPD